MDISQLGNKSFSEHTAVPVSVSAIVGSETNVLSLLNTRCVLRSLRLTSADPVANSVYVRLYELINSVLTNVLTYTITHANYDSYASLMDMFGLAEVSGDNIKVTVQTTAGTYAVTGEYSWASSA